MRALELQREILAACNDPAKLAAIAEREGIAPALWTYYTDLMAAVDGAGEDDCNCFHEFAPKPLGKEQR